MKNAFALLLLPFLALSLTACGSTSDEPSVGDGKEASINLEVGEEDPTPSASLNLSVGESTGAQQATIGINIQEAEETEE